ncbi:MAG TPA: hypothetical protein VMU03_15360 [Gammaproteobacteria bacterium]|nr:hypothetical protein [Gammaproteobacteria bacterium]
MCFSDPAWISPDAACASTPRRNSGYAAIAVGVATLLLGTVTLAADGPDTASDNKAADNTAAPEPAANPEAAATRETAEAPAIGSTQASEQHDATTGTASKDKKGAKAHKGNEKGQVEEVVVQGKQQEAEHCVAVQQTGSKVRRKVCTPVSQQQAVGKYQEQQAKDYLHRMSEQGSVATGTPSPYPQSGIPGLN